MRLKELIVGLWILSSLPSFLTGFWLLHPCHWSFCKDHQLSGRKPQGIQISKNDENRQLSFTTKLLFHKATCPLFSFKRKRPYLWTFNSLPFPSYHFSVELLLVLFGVNKLKQTNKKIALKSLKNWFAFLTEVFLKMHILGPCPPRLPGLVEWTRILISNKLFNNGTQPWLHIKIWGAFR